MGIHQARLVGTVLLKSLSIFDVWGWLPPERVGISSMLASRPEWALGECPQRMLPLAKGFSSHYDEFRCRKPQAVQGKGVGAHHRWVPSVFGMVSISSGENTLWNGTSQDLTGLGRWPELVFQLYVGQHGNQAQDLTVPRRCFAVELPLGP